MNLDPETVGTVVVILAVSAFALLVGILVVTRRYQVRNMVRIQAPPLMRSNLKELHAASEGNSKVWGPHLWEAFYLHLARRLGGDKDTWYPGEVAEEVYHAIQRWQREFLPGLQGTGAPDAEHLSALGHAIIRAVTKPSPVQDQAIKHFDSLQAEENED